mgnify:CR=1 FL=1
MFAKYDNRDDENSENSDKLVGIAHIFFAEDEEKIMRLVEKDCKKYEFKQKLDDDLGIGIWTTANGNEIDYANAILIATDVKFCTVFSFLDEEIDKNPLYYQLLATVEGIDSDDSEDDEYDDNETEENYEDEENKIAADLQEYDSDDDVTIFYDYNSNLPTYQKKKPSEDFIKLLDKWEEILQREDAPILVFNPKDKIPKIYAAAEDAWTRQIIFKYKTPKNDATLRFEFGRVYHISDLYTKECFLKLSYEKGSRKMEGSVNMYYPNGGFRGEAEVKLNIVKLLTYIGRNELAELVVNLQARTDAERKQMEEEALHKKWEKEEREQEAFEDEFDDL